MLSTSLSLCENELVISVDVEDWPQSTWDHSLEITQRAVENTERLLELLNSHQKTVTMFVLGKFAQRFPATVKRISMNGHEVASHGYGHIEIFKQTPVQFREDLQTSKALLEDLIGKPVIGYRAPDFSIISTTIWSLEILAELGFKYDSSIFPIQSKRYGIESWPAFPTRVVLPSGGSIIELPPATLKFLKRKWPVAGGGYHRLLSGRMIRWAIRQYMKSGHPFIAYCHPYEFDYTEFQEMNLKIPLATRLHQNIGRRGFRSKFESMIRNFKTSTASSIAMNRHWPDYKI